MSNARHAERHRLQLNVDLKSLKTQDVDNILFGQGYEDIQLTSLSMARPRFGMERAQTRDLSVSGLRLEGIHLKAGTAAVLDLHLPEDRVVVKALVEVVWVKVEDESPSAGCRFAAIQESGKERMQSFLQSQN